MIKTTLREIKGSLGRYLAIFAIVMLGIGFFAGLKMTRPSMVETEDEYLREQNFYDYRLLSTIGFTKEDVESIKEWTQAADVEGTISVDALCYVEEENEDVYKFLALPESINLIVLTMGRMPESADECILDASHAGEEMIGSVIRITDDNTEDTLEMFGARTYTVVGLANSPLYMNFERGTSSIGDGRITGFVYVPAEAFDCDYLTEIYLTLRDKYTVYSDEYDDYIDATQDELEDLTGLLVQDRYDGLIADAKEEIADAQKELDDKSAEAETELQDALNEIKDGEQEIADAEKEIADGEQEIADAEAEIADNERELTDGRTQLEQAKTSLAEQEAALLAQEEQINASSTILTMLQDQYALMQIHAAQEQLGQAKLELAAKEAQISEGEKQLQEAKKELEQAKNDIEEAKSDLEQAKLDLEEGKAEYEEAKAEYDEEVADAQKKIDDAQAELDDIEDPDYYVLTRNTNIGYVCFENDSNIVEAISDVFPLFFFLVAALICMTTMNRMVEEQRTQIGVLKALGYGNAAIMGKYAFYAGSAALVGEVVGFMGGTWLFPKVIWQAYRIMYNIDHINYQFSLGLAIVSIVAALTCSVGTAYLSCYYELHSVPANLIRPKAPKSGKRIFLEKVTFIWSRMKFLHKVSMRNIVRYKKRFFMMVLGISGCTALLVTGFGIKDSVADIAGLQFDEVQIYDIGLTLTDEAVESDRARLREETAEDFGHIAFHYEKSVDIDFNGKTKSITLFIPENPEETSYFLKLHTERGEELSYPKENEAIVTAKAAQSMGIQIGDEIVLRDADMRQIRVKVIGLCENFVYNYVYISKETYESRLGETPEYTSAFADVKEGKDIHIAAASASKLDKVMAVSVTQDMRERISSMMDSLDYIVLLVIVCAASLALIVLYNLTNINITERIREIATIKVLGFYTRETADYVFRENIVLTAIGALVGLGLGKALHWFIMFNINIDMVSFRTYVKPVSYLFSLLFTFGFAMLVNLLMQHKLDKINMAESLKSIE